MSPNDLVKLDASLSEEVPGYSDLDLRKRAFIVSMIETFGNIGQSCQAAGVKSRRTYYNWMHNDPVFAEIINGADFDELALDFAESKLMKRINEGDTIATIFFLKTKGKKRGYVEKAETNVNLNLNKAPSWWDQSSIPNTEQFEPIPFVDQPEKKQIANG